MKCILFIETNSFIKKNFEENFNQKFNISSLSYRYSSDLYNIIKFIKKNKPDYLIYLSINKNPKTKKEIENNIKNPLMLYNINRKLNYNGKFIYFSSINVLLKNCKDNYTITKRTIEKNFHNKKNVIIIRPSLIWSNKIEGDRKKLLNYLSSFLIFTPIIYRGSFVSLIYIKDFNNYLSSILDRKINNRYYNIFGNKFIYFYDLVKSEMFMLKKNILPLPIPIGIIFNLFTNVPSVLRGFNHLSLYKNLIKRNNSDQQSIKL